MRGFLVTSLALHLGALSLWPSPPGGTGVPQPGSILEVTVMTSDRSVAADAAHRGESRGAPDRPSALPGSGSGADIIPEPARLAAEPAPAVVDSAAPAVSGPRHASVARPHNQRPTGRPPSPATGSPRAERRKGRPSGASADATHAERSAAAVAAGAPGADAVRGGETTTATARSEARPALRPSTTEALRSRVLAMLAPEIRYPTLARRRGWEGTVTIELTLGASGRIERAAVARSSGHRVLDRAALDALRRMRTSVLEPEVGSPAASRPSTIQVPIEYRLQPAGPDTPVAFRAVIE